MGLDQLERFPLRALSLGAAQARGTRRADRVPRAEFTRAESARTECERAAHRLRALCLRALCLTAAGLACSAAQAEGSMYPMVMGLVPVAVQAGTTAERTIQSRYSMDGSYQILVSGTGVTGEVCDPRSTPVETRRRERNPAKNNKRGANLEQLKVRFHADKNALPGVRDFRLAGPYGASTVGQLVVVCDPVVVESADNDTPQKAQAIAVPSAVCGTIEAAEDRDCFKFHVEAGRALVFRVHGMRLENRIHDLQSHLDPIITLRKPAGTTLAVCDNDLSGDPLLSYSFAEAGEYVLEIRDVRYKGDRDWVYCVEINDRPFARIVYPMAAAPGRRTAFHPVGLQIAEAASTEWIVPKDADRGLNWVRLPRPADATRSAASAGDLLNPVALCVTDLPLVDESPRANDVLAKAQPIPAPCGVNGRVEAADDVDVYSFTAKKGDAFTFEVVSRRAGSPLDAALRIVDDRGRPLAEGDDLSASGRTFADAQIENWRVPADGTYAVAIRDLLQRGGPEFGYFLEIARAEPHFQLFLDTDKTELAPGTSAVLFVNSARKCGFDGPIALSIDGLPEGVHAFCDRIPAGHRDGCIILKADADCRLSASNITVRGAAQWTPPGRPPIELSAKAQPLQETYLPGGGRGHWPVETHAVAIGNAGSLLGVKLTTNEITLEPGKSVRVDVTIVRAPGFTDNVTLSPRFEHLGSVYGDTLPRGVEVDGKNSKTLLTGSETHGFITFRAAPTVEVIAKRPVAVMANVSINFVMKATYCSDPLFVTTRAGK